jgi:hypothetical protein
MNLNNLSEEQLEFILKGLELLSHSGVDMEDVLKISALHQYIDNTATEILNKMNNEEIPETLARMPNKDERQVLGRAEYVKPGQQ